MKQKSERKRQSNGGWLLMLGTLLIPTVAVAAHLAGDRASSEPPARVAKPGATEVAAPRRVPPETKQRPSPPKRSEQPETVAPERELPAAAKAVSVVEPPPERRTEAEVEAELEAAFAEAGPRTAADETNDATLRQRFDHLEIDTLECRGSRCRMELSFADSATAEKRLQDVFLDPQSELRLGGTITSRSTGRDGTAKVRVHLYAEEQNVPPEMGGRTNERVRRR